MMIQLVTSLGTKDRREQEPNPEPQVYQTTNTGFEAVSVVKES